MLRITQAAGAGQAKAYYTESLDRGDYYTEGQELAGRWGGKAAGLLGLSGEVSKGDFFAMCENRNPQTGGPLTLRTKTNRRTGYDINFHAPKDVSVAHALTDDPAILVAFEEAVEVTMRRIEADIGCRVRKDGAQEDRTTGNLAWAVFVHQTARPVDGKPEPHLHAHSFTFNATHDPVEGVWKAAQFGGIKRDGSYYEAAFHSAFRRGLEQAGYETEPDGRYFRLKEAPETLREKFSSRTQQVEAEARAKGIRDAKQKDQLGARTREAKQKSQPMSELRHEWQGRLDERESRMLAKLKGSPRRARSASAEKAEAKKFVQLAADSLFERDAVVSDKKLLTEAIRKSNARVDVDRLVDALNEAPFLRREEDGRTWLSTKATLAEEKEMLEFATSGMGQFAPYSTRFDAAHTKLSKSQARAATGILSSTDRVTVVRGGAGTGKTFMMKTVAEQIRSRKKEIHAFAPTTDAAHRVLRDDGFKDAETVQKLLVDPEVQKKLRGQVIWVDEAGMLGTRQLNQVFRIAKKQKARVILSGDDRQHGSVDHGKPFSLLRRSGVRSVELQDIIRQSGDYKQVVGAIAGGNRREAFRRLQQMGWVKESKQSDAHREIAKEVRTAHTLGLAPKTLVIAPTHKEKDKLTSVIRDELRSAKVIRGQDRKRERLKPRYFTNAEKAVSETYQRGQVICFNRRMRGFKPGERATVTAVDPLGNVWVRGKAAPILLGKSKGESFDVYEKASIELAQGDRVRITRNGKTKDGKHALRNGSEFEVAGFARGSGDIKLTNGWVVPKSFAHIDHAYVQTSNASQGKTVDAVLIAQSAESFGASNAEQFYVSLSRAKKAARVYTDDVEGLSRRIDRLAEMPNAHDAFGPENHAERTRERSRDDRGSRGR